MLKKYTRLVLIILLHIGLPLELYTQNISPGSVEGETLWIKPLLQGFTSKDYVYSDYSIFSQQVRIEKDKEYPLRSLLNFNPTFIFSSDQYSKDGILLHKNTNLEHSTIIGVYQPTHYSSDQNILKSFKDDDSYDFVLSSDSIKIKKQEPPVVRPSYTSFSGGFNYGQEEGHDLIEDSSSGLFSKPRILVYYRLNESYSHGIWGLPKDPRKLSLSPSDKKTTSLHLKFGGLIPELVTYDRMLTPKERLRVESYLAVKYGIHLTGDYTRSDDFIIWSQSDHQDYHHRVTGIGRDDQSQLDQKKSTSSYEDPKGLLTIGELHYQKDNNQNCSDCARYDLLNSNQVELKDDALIYNASNTTLRRRDVGGLLDIPLAVGESVSFQFNQEKNSSSFLGLSSKSPNEHWDGADFGIKKENNNQLSWCKKGKCEDLHLPYTGQTIRLKAVSDQVILQLDDKEIKKEYSTPSPLLISFTLQGKTSRLEHVQIHKNTLGRPLEDKEYYLWGDNNNQLSKNERSGILGLTTINRIWKINHSDISKNNIPFLTKLELDYERFKTFFPEGADDEYYLVIDQKGEGKFDESSRLKLHPIKIIPVGADKKIWAFETIWDEDASGSDAFTIGYSKTFLATVKVQEPICSTSKGSMSLEIISGKQHTPIHYALYFGGKLEKEGEIEDAENPILLDNLLAGEYQLTLKNKLNKISEQTVRLEAPQGIQLEIPQKVNLIQNGSVTIDGSKGQPSGLQYEWRGPFNYSYHGAKARIEKPGEYTLKAYRSPECYTEQTVTVSESNIKEIKTYPIPLKLDQYLTVEAFLHEPEEAQLVIYDMNGLIIYKNERKVTSTRHRFKLSFPRKDVYRAKLITKSSSEEFGITVN